MSEFKQGLLLGVAFTTINCILRRKEIAKVYRTSVDELKSTFREIKTERGE